MNDINETKNNQEIKENEDNKELKNEDNSKKPLSKKAKLIIVLMFICALASYFLGDIYPIVNYISWGALILLICYIEIKGKKRNK